MPLVNQLLGYPCVWITLPSLSLQLQVPFVQNFFILFFLFSRFPYLCCLLLAASLPVHHNLNKKVARVGFQDFCTFKGLLPIDQV